LEFAQYLSDKFRALCDGYAIRQSAGRVATCFDNSVAESFWSSLKRELVHRYRFATKADATAAITAAITAWIKRYNNVRLSLGSVRRWSVSGAVASSNTASTVRPTQALRPCAVCASPEWSQDQCQ
jgi:transposase InsO family protein